MWAGKEYPMRIQIPFHMYAYKNRLCNTFTVFPPRFLVIACAPKNSNLGYWVQSSRRYIIGWNFRFPRQLSATLPPRFSWVKIETICNIFKLNKAISWRSYKQFTVCDLHYRIWMHRSLWWSSYSNSTLRITTQITIAISVHRQPGALEYPRWSNKLLGRQTHWYPLPFCPSWRSK